MLQVFNHNPDEGVCTYISLFSNDSDDYLELVKAFLYGQKIEVDGEIGFARLHPEDKNYKKSTGREIAVQNAKSTSFNLMSIYKKADGRVVLRFKHEETDTEFLALVSYKKRPHLKLY